MSEIFVLFVLTVHFWNQSFETTKLEKESKLPCGLYACYQRLWIHIMKHGDASICSSAVFLITWCSVQSWFPLLCVLSVSWLLCGSSSRCHGFVCSLWLWYLVFILIIFNLEHPIGPFERQLAQFWMSTGLLFVDNWVLYRKIYSLQDCLILQEEFNSLA